MQMTRRDFLRSAAMSAALAAVAGPAGVARAAEANTPEKWVKGVCRYCGTGCGVLVGVKNGKAVAIKGDPNNHNQGFLCLKGALLIPVLNSPDRVTKPMIRRTKGGRLEPISWDEALDHMAKKFRTTIDTYGPDAVAWYGSGQCLTEESYLANKIFKAGFKTNNVDGNPRLCMASAVGGYTTTFGKDEPMGTYADIDRASAFFIIGSNTSEAHPVLFRRIARRKQNEPGVKIIVADPRRTNTSRIADLHIAFRPGTDLALMNGMAWVILHEELDNPRFYNKYAIFKTSDGKDATFDDYRAFLEDYTPDKVAKLCNIPEQQVWEAGRLFAESPATAQCLRRRTRHGLALPSAPRRARGRQQGPPQPDGSILGHPAGFHVPQCGVSHHRAVRGPRQGRREGHNHLRNQPRAYVAEPEQGPQGHVQSGHVHHRHRSVPRRGDA